MIHYVIARAALAGIALIVYDDQVIVGMEFSEGWSGCEESEGLCAAGSAGRVSYNGHLERRVKNHGRYSTS